MKKFKLYAVSMMKTIDIFVRHTLPIMFLGFFIGTIAIGIGNYFLTL